MDHRLVGVDGVGVGWVIMEGRFEEEDQDPGSGTPVQGKTNPTHRRGGTRWTCHPTIHHRVEETGGDEGDRAGTTRKAQQGFRGTLDDCPVNGGPSSRRSTVLVNCVLPERRQTTPGISGVRVKKGEGLRVFSFIGGLDEIAHLSGLKRED